MKYNVITTPHFERQFKNLLKTYKRLETDIEPFISKLEDDYSIGTSLGSNIYKLRISSSDSVKGKKGGFRLLYYFLSKDNIIYFLTIYSKAKKKSININELKNIIKSITE